jgi:F-type H+-transporting ATPase subunit c
MTQSTRATDKYSTTAGATQTTKARSFKKMDPVAAKYIGAGLAAIGMGAAAIGVGVIFGNFLSGALRNPSASDGQFGRAFIGAALAEGLGIFAFLVAILLLFVM